MAMEPKEAISSNPPTDDKDASVPSGIGRVGEDEEGIALRGPAPFTNKFYVTGFKKSGVIRIAFAEQIGKLPPEFRGAVTFSQEDALVIMETLRMILDQLSPGKPK